MDFFARQDQARRNTSVLVVYFAAAVVMIVIALNLVGLVVLNAYRIRQGNDPRRYPERVGRPVEVTWWDTESFLFVTAGTLAVIVGGSLFKIGQLAGGGKAVAEMMGAIPVPPNTSDPRQQVLRNVVEEMSIASGIPTPSVYVMPDEEGINAFAAGFTTRDAVVCVTQGSLTKLSRDELQGVIAHEFSHILNGDMTLNLRLIGILFGILLIGLIGYGMIRASAATSSRSDRDSGGAQFAMLAIGALVAAIGFIGLFFGRLIQASVCRQREFLADAAAVQFTRNPQGLAGALQKLGAMSSGSRLHNHDAEQMAHMFFGSSLGIEFGGFATHPPLAQRIKAIDPSWDGRFPPPSAPTTLDRYSEPVPNREALTMSIPIAAAGIVEAVGAPMPRHIEWASDFLTSIPDPINAAAHEPFSARALVFALLLADGEEDRQKQLALLAAQADGGTLNLVKQLSGPVDQLGARARRVLLDLALPALRQLSGPQCTQFHQTVDSLIEADGAVSLFEYMMRRILNKYLPPGGSPKAASLPAYYAVKPLADDIEVVLSALATADEKDAPAIASSFKTGAARLGDDVSLSLRRPVALNAVDAAINHIAQAAPGVKRRIVDACAYCVAADGLVQTEEGELLRAITTAWDCPMPPLLAQHASVAQTA